jgi:hypothetical protein
MGTDDQSTRASTRRFVLEAFDAVTECPTIEAIFDVGDVAELCSLIDPKATDIDRGAIYELDQHDVEQIKVRFNVQFNPGPLAVQLRSWHPLDELPYKVHTRRELALMLNGTKPLAAFSGQYPPNLDVEEIPERLFDPYVAAGRFIKREYVVPAGAPATLGGQATGTWRIVLYASKGHEWRINAYILLYQIAAKAGWSEGFERMQGSLLGYEEWQNDVFIEKIYKRARQ